MNIQISSILLLTLLLASCKTTVSPMKKDSDSSVSKATVDSDDFAMPSSDDAVLDTLPDYFFIQLWVHRFEQDKGELQVYKPVLTSIAPMRYRNQLTFQKNGICSYRWLAPNDAHEIREGSWLYDSPNLYILKNKVDIIDKYIIKSLSDTLLVMIKEQSPLDKIYGKWQLDSSNNQDLSYLGYQINIKGREIEIRNKVEVLHEYAMEHSERKLQEPLALIFDKEINRLYPWINSGQYGVVNDTLVIEIQDGVQSKFLR